MTNNKHAEFAKQAVALLKSEFIVSVYSGKPGCACGCNGNHRYNSKHVKEAARSRGYLITEDEISDRQVARVLAVVQANADKLEAWEPGDNNFAVTTTTDAGTERLYIVYPTEAYVNMSKMAVNWDMAQVAQADAYVELAAR